MGEIKTRRVVNIDFTEGEIQQLLDVYLDMDEDDDEEIVFTWNPLDDQGNPVEVNISVNK